MKKNILNVTTYFLVGIIFFAYVILDYFLLKPTIGVNTGTSYWIGQGITVVLILLTMVLMRSARKNDKISKNKKIEVYQGKLEKQYRIIANNNLYDNLEEFVDEYNKKTKYSTFLKKITKKISKCKNKEKKAKLIALRNTPREDVLKMNVRYTKISSTTLYSNVLIKTSDDPNKTKIHDGLDTLKMILQKASFLIVGALFTGSVVYDFWFSGASALFGTLMKVVLIVSAIIGAIYQADKFVTGEIETALMNRIRISISFITSKEEIKKKFGVEETIMEKVTNEIIEVDKVASESKCVDNDSLNTIPSP